MPAARRETILYLSTNDGSDTRIVKQVETLSSRYSVVFLGVGRESSAFIEKDCDDVILVRGIRNRPFTIFRQWGALVRVLAGQRIYSIHVVNEQLLVLVYPLLLFHHVVLDVFDSIFLRWNKGGDRWGWVKRIVYWPANRIIVTDENRLQLLPRFAQERASIVENFPPRYAGPTTRRDARQLTLLFAGTLAMPRGGTFVEEVLNADPNANAIMAGWLYDDGVKSLAQHPRASYRGVLPQEDVLTIAATEADYIVCLYPLTNDNNVNASPNKIWDAVQTKTPVIINTGVKVSRLVSDLNIGVVVDQGSQSILDILDILKRSQGEFEFDDQLASTHS